MRFRKLLLISILLIALTISAVSAEDNLTLSADESLEVSVEATNAQTHKTFDDVRTIINSAKENDTIELDGYYEGDGSPITIKKSLTINGNNAVLDGKSESKIIDLRVDDSQNCVFLKDITFTNGYSTRNAGAINGGTLFNCTFKNCVADQRGGAAAGSHLEKCTLIDCYAQRGGALS